MEEVPTTPAPATPAAATPATAPAASVAADGEPRQSAGWSRILVAAAAALAFVLVGATVGLLLAQSRTPATVIPAPDSVAVGFCQDMTVHHRQAVRMAGYVRNISTDPAIKRLAFDIETGQIDQIGRMQGWLNIWGRDSLPVAGHMGWMAEASHGGHGGSGGSLAQMPGMATHDELTRLESLTSPELDTLFLQLMLRHHQGGLPMMDYAAAHAEVGVVRNIAYQMQTAQDEEIGLLTHMLAQRGAAPLPAPS